MTTRRNEQWPKWEKRVRDSVIFTLGVAGTLNEFFVEVEPRWPALTFIAAIFGLPFVLNADESRAKK